MVVIYVIESLTDGIWYTGIALNAFNRLKEHNSGKNRFTKGHMPWKIIYTETATGWHEARLKGKIFEIGCWQELVEKIC